MLIVNMIVSTRMVRRDWSKFEYGQVLIISCDDMRRIKQIKRDPARKGRVLFSCTCCPCKNPGQVVRDERLVQELPHNSAQLVAI